MKTRIMTMVSVCAMTGAAMGQSLFNAPTPPPASPTPAPAAPANPEPQPAPANAPAEEKKPAAAVQPPAIAPRQAPSVREMGMFVVTPPKVRDFQKHDKVEILINETSIQKFEQKQDNKENYDLKAELKQFPSLVELLRRMTLKDGIGSNTPNAGAAGGSTYKGQGTYERKDNFTAKISGLVVDVKPNGLMLVEARESIQSDKEVKTMVVSGLVDPKDVTNTNSVFSTQMADLCIKVEHTGDVKDAATKGWLPRAFDWIVGN